MFPKRFSIQKHKYFFELSDPRLGKFSLYQVIRKIISLFASDKCLSLPDFLAGLFLFYPSLLVCFRNEKDSRYDSQFSASNSKETHRQMDADTTFKEFKKIKDPKTKKGIAENIKRKVEKEKRNSTLEEQKAKKAKAKATKKAEAKEKRKFPCNNKDCRQVVNNIFYFFFLFGSV